MNLLLVAVAITVGGLIVLIRRSKSTKVKKSVDDTPVVVGDCASAFIESKTSLSAYSGASGAGHTLTHPDHTRKWSKITVTDGGQTVVHPCTGGPCQVSLTFDSGLELTVSTVTGSGLEIESSEDFSKYQKAPTRWVQKNAGYVNHGFVEIGGNSVNIGPGPGCTVRISYKK